MADQWSAELKPNVWGLDWSERRPHVGGAVGAAVLGVALKRRWVVQDLDSRELDVASLARRETLARFGLRV